MIGRSFRWSPDHGQTWVPGHVTGGVQEVGPLLVEFVPLLNEPGVREPISYTEFHRRFEAANAETRFQKVLLKKDGSEPTTAEFAKQRAVMERHGIIDFELSWDASNRRFTLQPVGN